MPKVSEMIVSKFLRKEDCDDDELPVTIKSCALEDMPGDDHQQRWVLYFRELPKGLVLNATIIKVLAKAFGNDSDDWVGKKASLFCDDTVQYKGQIVGGLRLRPAKNKPAKTPLVEVGEGDFDEVIP